jgi:Flp pilus assembly pilin Flp
VVYKNSGSYYHKNYYNYQLIAMHNLPLINIGHAIVSEVWPTTIFSTYMRPSLTRRRFRPSTLTRLARDRQGVTTLEFAFITPVILLMILGIVEFSLIMFTMAATAATSRTGKTGWTAEGLSREQTIINSITSRTAGLLDAGSITITTTIYPSFNNVNDPEPYVDANGNGMYNAGETYTDINGNGEWDEDMGATGLGGPGDVVVYNISYPWDIKTPIVGALIGDPFTITVRSVVKNEPFNDGM